MTQWQLKLPQPLALAPMGEGVVYRQLPAFGTHSGRIPDVCTLGYSMPAPCSPARCFGPNPLAKGRRFQLPRIPRTNRSRSASCGGGPCARSSLHRDGSRRGNQIPSKRAGYPWLHTPASSLSAQTISPQDIAQARQFAKPSLDGITAARKEPHKHFIRLARNKLSNFNCLQIISSPCPSSSSPAKTSLLDTATGVLRSALSSV